MLAGISEGGVDPQGGFESSSRFVEFALQGQRATEEVVRHWIGRHQPDRLFGMQPGHREVVPIEQRRREIAFRISVPRVDIDATWLEGWAHG